MPENKTDEKLAEEFANFFIEKIETIRNDLDKYGRYKPKGKIDAKLRQFDQLTEEKVQKIISKSSSKHVNWTQCHQN